MIKLYAMLLLALMVSGTTSGVRKKVEGKDEMQYVACNCGCGGNKFKKLAIQRKKERAIQQAKKREKELAKQRETQRNDVRADGNITASPRG